MKKTIILNHQWRTELIPKSPFNFEGTVYNPAHFPTPTEKYQPGKWRQTMRFQGKPLGIRLENQGTIKNPKVKLTVYSQKLLNQNFKKDLVKEIKYRFELDLDLSKFNQKFKKDRVLGPVIKKWLGMRSKCGYDLYESLMIYVVLQNATVRRTIQMMDTLLNNYGKLIKFDSQKLYVFWEPAEMDEASEQALRDLKVGYRAKFFKRISEDFVESKFDEKKMRCLANEKLKEKLIQLFGIGPASLDYLLFEVFHRHDALETLPPWEQKIYSRLFYNKPLVSKERILKRINRWGKWKKLAAHYVWTDLFWQHQRKPIAWLAKEIRR